MKLLLENVSHMERIETTGRLSKDIAVRLGVTGVAARASGIHDDIRKAHPHLLYDRLHFELHTTAKGDVFARMMVRAEEAECSLSMIIPSLKTATVVKSDRATERYPRSFLCAGLYRNTERIGILLGQV